MHKLVVLSRKPSPEKQAKDKEAVTRLLRALIDEKQAGEIKVAFEAMPRRWRSKVRQQLTDPLDATMLNIVTE